MTEAESLRLLAYNLQTKGKSLDVKSLPLEDRILLGHALDSLTKQAGSILDRVKQSLREEATQDRGGVPGTHHFPQVQGVRCSVQLAAPQVSIRKGADVAGLKTRLGSQFGDLFRERVLYTPRQGFADRVADFKDSILESRVMRTVEIVTDTPRVFFKDG